MTILQAGVAKSGNYWLYKILKNICSNYLIEEKSYIQNHPIYPISRQWKLSYKDQRDIDVLDIGPVNLFFRISSIFRMPIDDIDEYLKHCTLVWTHSAVCTMSHTVLPKFDKVVYIVRDPRDMAVSLSKFMFTDYMRRYYPTRTSDYRQYLADKLDWLTSLWVDHVCGYLRIREKVDIHIVFYERLLSSFESELSKLLQYLNLTADAEKIGTIQNQVVFEKMKAENPAHVRKGKSGGWRNELSASQARRVSRIAGPLLEMLHYPNDKSQNLTDLPHLPPALSSEEIDRCRVRSKKMPLVRKLRKIARIACA